ncbi:MAG: PEP-CTERM sorting domain-containing protein [Acidobacteriia bacterium]|nr:PEP-CTERM sorting domain-containing protein [Terriglobia bacterium]
MKVFRVTAVVILLLSVAAFADDVTFQTNPTYGCFGNSCTPTSPNASITDLSFVGTGYGPHLTSGGALNITLGSFTLTDSQNTTFNSQFDALIRFYLPTGTGSQSVNAAVTGSVDVGWLSNSGTAVINFSDNWTTYSFDGGTFQFKVNDVTLSAGQFLGFGNVSDTESLVGQVQNVHLNSVDPPPPPPGQTPEPGSLVLMGSGLMTMAGVLRRKLRR